MSGQIIGGVGGAVAGFFLTGGNPLGALRGFSIGYALGGMLDPPKGPAGQNITQQGQRLDDLTVQSSTYGASIPRVQGTVAITGNLIWLENNQLREVATTTTQSSGGGGGGKGGGGGGASPSTVTTTTYGYYATFAVGLCKGPIVGVRRIWLRDALVYDAGSDDAGTIAASNAMAAGFTLHLGTDTQAPDARMQATLGAANTPAYRGLAYIVFLDLALAPYGNTLLGAQVKVEIVNGIDPPTMNEILEDEVLQSRLLKRGDIDASELTTVVRGYTVASSSMIRSHIDQLQGLAPFDLVQSGYQIVARARGRASIATVDIDEMVAQSEGERITSSREMPSILPSQVVINYLDIDRDYAVGDQPAERLNVDSVNVQTIQMSMVLTATEAANVAQTLLYLYWLERYDKSFKLPPDYLRLEAADVLTVVPEDGGSAYEVRLTTIMYAADGTLDCAAKYNRPSVYSPANVGSSGNTGVVHLSPLADTLIELMDIPILVDADNDSGFYVAAKGDAANYPGSVIVSSVNDVDYVQRAVFNAASVFGTCTTVLGDWTGPRVFDETNSVTVDLGEGELASSTRTAILNNQAVNAMLIGSELLQFRTATPVSAGVYKLTGLLRGGRGTEWAMVDHVADERAVLITAAGLRRIVLPNSDLGVPRYYKGVTIGAHESDVTPELFTDNAVGLKPFSPFDLRMVRDGSNNITGTFQRRTRLSVRTIGTLGISVPLGETTEAYDIDVFSDNTYTTVVRTISTATTSFTYSAAEQTADGLTPGNTVYTEIFQRSAEVGRGYPLREAA